jgi:hypothetical protein
MECPSGGPLHICHDAGCLGRAPPGGAAWQPGAFLELEDATGRLGALLLGPAAVDFFRALMPEAAAGQAAARPDEHVLREALCQLAGQRPGGPEGM